MGAKAHSARKKRAPFLVHNSHPEKALAVCGHANRICHARAQIRNWISQSGPERILKAILVLDYVGFAGNRREEERSLARKGSHQRGLRRKGDDYLEALGRAERRNG